MVGAIEVTSGSDIFPENYQDLTAFSHMLYKKMAGRLDTQTVE